MSEGTDDPHWVEPNEGSKVNVDLGDGHTLTWTSYKGVIVGGIIRHTMSISDRFPKGYCDGAFWIKGNEFTRDNKPSSPEWDFNGDLEKPTLSPSFDCHCKHSHGWVRDGKWIRA